MKKYLTSAEIKKTYNISVVSLRTWERLGVLHPIRTPGGHRGVILELNPD
ncbi:MAG: MerR family DNA-binding transcriptional regulator [Desulfitobacteriaceae bacterium]|nr:MerR family DNA-binding transcriptional regulator [Desulfitobacteriaceae bacterium]MDI6913363.1 MerR family DNA-binding transcriptional regulator [Desulfitobacteriaceae bacterium]